MEFGAILFWKKKGADALGTDAITGSGLVASVSSTLA